MSEMGYVRAWVAIGIVGVVASDPAVSAPRPVSTAALDVHADLGARDPAACAPCHAEIVAEWSDSAHAVAWTDPIFQAEYALEPEASCRGCHAPASRGGPVDAVAAHGVDCVACHERGGRIVAFAASANAVEESSACGACHDFAFPDDTQRYAPGDALQRTRHEWRDSRAAARGRSCISCHMPRFVDAVGRTRPSHRVLGLRDPEFLARAVETEASAARTAAGIEVRVQLRSGAIGHAFPTGDMFRTARVIVATDEATVDAELTRTFGWLPDDSETEMVLREVEDTRLMADGLASFVLTLPHSDASRVSWRVVVDRLDPEVAAARGLPLDAVRHEVAAGELEVR